MTTTTARRFLRAFTGILLIAGAFWWAFAAAEAALIEHSRDLENVVAGLGDEDFVKVIVMLREQVDFEQALADIPPADYAAKQIAVVSELRELAAVNQKPVLELLKNEMGKGNIKFIRPFWIMNAVGIELKVKLIDKIRKMREVDTIKYAYSIPMPQVEAAPAIPATDGPEWNISKIKAPDLWAMGYKGQNIVIGSFDTGVDGNHAALKTRYLGGAHAWYDPYEEHSTPYDGGGHGTHTTGTVCGGNEGGSDIGVAPNAKWMAGKAWNDDGYGGIMEFVELFEWFLDPDGNPQTADAPRVVSNSWGIVYEGCLIDFMRLVDAWVAAGIFPSFAAGNEGPGYASSSSPGNYPQSFGVGATSSSDGIASFSGRGPSACNESLIKPDVCAPGVSVRSSTPGGGYQSWSGTSMACPHATGAVALLLSYDSGLTIQELSDALKYGSIDLGKKGPDNDYGYGRMDLKRSIDYLKSRGTLAGYIKEAGTMKGLEALIQVQGSWRSVQAQPPDGYYFMKLPGDSTYALSASLFGYITKNFQVNVPYNGNVTRNVELTPQPSGMLSGVVKDFNGFAAEGAEVSLKGIPVDPVKTDPDGKYEFASLPANATYNVHAEMCELLPVDDQIMVKADTVVFLDFELPELAADNVEHGENGWTHYIVTPNYVDQWHITNKENHTSGGSHSWWCADPLEGGYTNYLDAALETHCFDIQSGGILTFWHKIDSELNTMFPWAVWDGGIVEISDDNGETWTQIMPVGGYPYIIEFNPACPFEWQTPAYGSTRPWEKATFILTGWSGEVKFRFRFGSDGLVTRTGWWIDDVLVTSTSYDVTIEALNPPTNLTPGQKASWDVHVENHEQFAVTADIWLEIEHSGQVVKTVVIKSAIKIPAGFSGNGTVALTVPLSTPSGTYTVRNIAGLYPDYVYGEDSFVVNVAAAATAAGAVE